MMVKDEEHQGNDDEEDYDDDLAQYFEAGNPIVSMEDFFMQWAKLENKSNMSSKGLSRDGSEGHQKK